MTLFLAITAHTEADEDADGATNYKTLKGAHEYVYSMHLDIFCKTPDSSCRLTTHSCNVVSVAAVPSRAPSREPTTAPTRAPTGMEKGMECMPWKNAKQMFELIHPFR